MTDADRIIELLDLKPHPEGGYYRQMFEDGAAADGRAHSTAIYYLLKQGEVSRAHRIDATEVWHFYRGSPLELTIQAEGEAAAFHVLGAAVEFGERPQLIVPPQPSPTGPQFATRSVHVFGVHVLPTPHTLAVPPPPQV